MGNSPRGQAKALDLELGTSLAGTNHAKREAANAVRLAPQRRYGLEWVCVDKAGQVVELHDDKPGVDRRTWWKVSFLSVLVPESLL